MVEKERHLGESTEKIVKAHASRQNKAIKRVSKKVTGVTSTN